MRARLRRSWVITLGVAVLATIGVALIWQPGDKSRHIPAARTRTTIAFTACVLTDSHGIAGKDAAPAWRGVLNAQASTNLRAQSLQVAGKGRTADAVIAVNTLTQRSCNLIIAAGDPQVAAVWKQASLYPEQDFLVIDVAGHPVSGNVAVVTTPDATTIASKVATATKNLVAGRFTPGQL
jgi:basic membrane lipoprotein Med (substrate-binding protein (PBP1-ABC) superfamily)